jgi:hypothetical protein
VGPVPDPLLLSATLAAPGIEPGTSESVDRNSLMGHNRANKKKKKDVKGSGGG